MKISFPMPWSDGAMCVVEIACYKPDRIQVWNAVKINHHEYDWENWDRAFPLDKLLVNHKSELLNIPLEMATSFSENIGGWIATIHVSDEAYQTLETCAKAWELPMNNTVTAILRFSEHSQYPETTYN